MKYCERIRFFDPLPVLRQLETQPELWGQHRVRTAWREGPFTETDDIWVRFGDDPQTMAGPHFAAFYPAWHALPALHGLVFDLMRQVEATTLGGILITKVPAGRDVKPHSDRGFWHPEFYLTKAYAIFQSNDLCINRFPGEEVAMRAGEIWLFDNLVEHSVENRGKIDRIAAVICMRQA